MPQLTRDQVINLARAELHEPVDGRYYKNDPEMYLWLRLTLDEIAERTMWEKKFLSFAGNSATYYLQTINGTKYYKMPDDFMMLDPDAGVNFEGVRRIGTTNRQVDSYQESVLGGQLTSPTSGTTAQFTASDYFRDNFNGIIAHYAVDMVINGSTGYSTVMMWFTPNPEDDTTINLRYIPQPADISASGATTIKLMPQFNEAMVAGLVLRAARKKLHDREVSAAYIKECEARSEKIITRIDKFLKVKRTPDRTHTIKSARQALDAYNSTGKARRGYVYGSSDY